MAKIKLQYSIICERDEKYVFKNIIHGFIPGIINEFYVTNKWVWDEGYGSDGIEDGVSKDIAATAGDIEEEDGYYQVTEIVRGDEVLIRSESEPFRVKLSHTHHNRFRQVRFNEKGIYRVRVKLYDSQGREIESGSLEYPVFVGEKGL